MTFTGPRSLSEELRQLTYALYRRRSLDKALHAAYTRLDQPAVIEALLEIIASNGASFDRQIEIIERLSSSEHAAIDATLTEVVTSHPLIKVRVFAADVLADRAPAALPWALLERRLALESAYQVRARLTQLLANAPAPHCWRAVTASDDPHWRVRRPIITALDKKIPVEGYEPVVEAFKRALAARQLDDDRTRGLLAYLKLYHHPQLTVQGCEPEPAGRLEALDLSERPWWHEEPAVMKGRLEAMSKAQALQEERWLVWLLSHPDERVRSVVMGALYSGISAQGVISFLLHASEPRQHNLEKMRERFMERINQDTLERCALMILKAWMSGQPLSLVAGLPPVLADEAQVVAWALVWLDRHIKPRVELLAHTTWQDALWRALAAPQAAARLAAMTILDGDATLRERGAAQLQSLLDDQDVEVAARALLTLGDTLSDEALLARREGATFEDHRYRLAWLEVVHRRDMEAMAPAWAMLCADAHEQVRAKGAALLVRARASGAQLAQQAQALLLSAQQAADAQLEQAAAALVTLIEQRRLTHPSRSYLAQLSQDPSPAVRASALEVETAQRLLEAPQLESSWLVLERAATLCGKRLEASVPQSWVRALQVSEAARVEVAGEVEQPRIQVHEAEIEVAFERAAAKPPEDWWSHRPLGQTGLSVSRMGISGHYMLPEQGFALALERGINTFFWEPIYLSQTRFFKETSRSLKASLVTSCGTFESSAKGMRRDIERALRAMDLEQIQVFYIFWVRDKARLNDELLREMERCQREGLVHTFGVSTHSRELAQEFIQRWPAVMVRHNAAHRGVEREVLPYVDPAKTGLITFSNLCYGRMISELPGFEGGVPSARDAYRYTLSHQGVLSCWSAPSTLAQLEENLSALDEGPMQGQELEALRAYGDALYRLNTGFGRFVRMR